MSGERDTIFGGASQGRTCEVSEREQIIAHIQAKAATLRKLGNNPMNDWASQCAAILTGVVDDINAGLHIPVDAAD